MLTSKMQHIEYEAAFDRGLEDTHNLIVYIVM